MVTALYKVVVNPDVIFLWDFDAITRHPRFGLGFQAPQDFGASEPPFMLPDSLLAETSEEPTD
jgi:hypothetical protein